MAKSHKSSGRYLYAVIGLLLVVIAGLIAKMYFPFSVANDEVETFKLPEKAVKISECLPFMGEHWVEPDKLPFGPMYVMNGGMLMSLEYMFTPDKFLGEDFVKLPPQEVEKYLKDRNMTWADYFRDYKIVIDLPDLDKKYKSIEIAWSPPHAGLVEPHYDVHVGFEEESDMSDVCPDANVYDSFAPSLLESIRKNNIQIPGE